MRGGRFFYGKERLPAHVFPLPPPPPSFVPRQRGMKARERVGRGQEEKRRGREEEEKRSG